MENNEKLEKIRSYAFWLLEKRMYSTEILREKIETKFGASKEVDYMIKRLQELNYLNDKVFCETFVRNRINLKPSGKYKLSQELKLKKISPEIYEPILDNIDEEPLARQALEKKQKTLNEKDPYKKKDKLMRYLLGRGFGYDVVKNVLSEDK